MTIAFDLDGTISQSPPRFAGIMAALFSTRHRVIVLTAAAGELPPHLRPPEVERRLQNIGICRNREYTELICCESHEKGAICALQQIDFMIDDSPDVMHRIGAVSPNTLRLQIL